MSNWDGWITKRDVIYLIGQRSMQLQEGSEPRTEAETLLWLQERIEALEGREAITHICANEESCPFYRVGTESGARTQSEKEREADEAWRQLLEKYEQLDNLRFQQQKQREVGYEP